MPLSKSKLIFVLCIKVLSDWEGFSDSHVSQQYCGCDHFEVQLMLVLSSVLRGKIFRNMQVLGGFVPNIHLRAICVFFFNTTCVLWNFPDGKLFTLGNLDFETVTSYNVTVFAYDLGTPQRSSKATVLITVLDVEDTTVIQPLYEFYISGVTQLHSVIGTIKSAEKLYFNITGWFHSIPQKWQMCKRYSK